MDYSQTGQSNRTTELNSSSSDVKEQKNYVFSDAPVIFINESSEETITKEDEIKFYKKIFETKGK